MLIKHPLNLVQCDGCNFAFLHENKDMECPVCDLATLHGKTVINYSRLKRIINHIYTAYPLISDGKWIPIDILEELRKAIEQVND